ASIGSACAPASSSRTSAAFRCASTGSPLSGSNARRRDRSRAAALRTASRGGSGSRITPPAIVIDGEYARTIYRSPRASTAGGAAEIAGRALAGRCFAASLAVHLNAADLDQRLAGQEAERLVGRDTARDKRPGHDRAEPLHREDAVDRQPRGGVGSAAAAPAA